MSVSSLILHVQVTVSGYAVSGGGRGIERVDVSVDGGKTWLEASRYQKIGTPYVADDVSSDKWAWVLFEITVDVSNNADIVAKAVCHVSSSKNMIFCKCILLTYGRSYA